MLITENLVPSWPVEWWLSCKLISEGLKSTGENNEEELFFQVLKFDKNKTVCIWWASWSWLRFEEPYVGRERGISFSKSWRRPVASIYFIVISTILPTLTTSMTNKTLPSCPKPSWCPFMNFLPCFYSSLDLMKIKMLHMECKRQCISFFPRDGCFLAAPEQSTLSKACF